MFEKEAEEYADNEINKMFVDESEEVYVRASTLKQIIKNSHLKGLEKANEWHYVKDGDLPNTETKNYSYIRRRKRYERQFTDYRVIKCFVLCLNEKGKITAEVGYFDCKQKYFLDKAEGMVYAWKEIVLPKESEND